MKCFLVLSLLVSAGFLQLSQGLLKMPPRVDICAVIDTSTLELAIKFLKELLDHMSVSPSTTRLAVITSGSDVKIHFNFQTYVNRECTLKALDNIQTYKGGKFASSSVLETAITLFNNSGNFYAKKLLFYFTSGQSVNEHRHLSDNPDFNQDFPEYEDDWPSATFAEREDIEPNFFHREEEPFKYNLKELHKENIEVFSFLVGKHSELLGDHVFDLQDESHISKIISHLPFAKKSFTKCHKNGVVYDECRRRCICQDGKLTECTRIRKEFTEMSKEEKQRYVRTFKTLSTDDAYKKRFEKYAGIHKGYFTKGIHTKERFLPWHRWYMWRYENVLKEVDCRNTLPYWDWIYWSDRAWDISTGIWKSTDEDGFGGNGDRDRGYCVQTGPFREGFYDTMSFDNPEKVQEQTSFVADSGNSTEIAIYDKRCVRRFFNGKPHGPKTLKKLLKYEPQNFTDFEKYVRVDYHNGMHNRIGGHMCTIYASLTPEFYLHHAILDKIWYVWQQKGGRYKYAFFRCMGDPMKKYKCPYSQNQLIDSKDLPGCVRVEYSDFASRNFEINHEWKNNEKLEECNNEEASRNMSDDNLGDEEDGNYLEELQFDSPELKPGLLQPFNGPELDSGSIFE